MTDSKSELVIGTRGSSLATSQSGWVAERIAALNPGLSCRLEIVKTQGDVSNQAPLWQIGGGGLFVRELERALLDGRIDVAVHSMKDLPSDTAPDLVIAAVPGREDPRDVLVSSAGGSLSDLPRGARVGTSSSRRRAQLLAFRPDLQIVPLRGNVDTRLRKGESGELDAVVLAAAGLSRLGFIGRATGYIPVDVCLPAIGQGALAVQTRAGDGWATRLLAGLEDRATRAATEAERAFMEALGGGCQVPMAALCRQNGDRLVLEAMVASPDGARVLRGTEVGDPANPRELGYRLAEQLRRLGAGELLAAHS